ncbi:hypothetical protein P7C73_g4004, partial [Tremellales sp. Uapishka_1]
MSMENTLHHLVSRIGFEIPAALQVYDSYTVDPEWQIKFTIIWTSILAFTTLLSVPYIVHSFRTGRLYSGLFIRESDHASLSSNSTTRPSSSPHPPSQTSVLTRTATGLRAVYQSLALWTLPMPNLTWWKGQVGDCCRQSYFSLGIGQIFIVLAYAGIVVACFVVGAELLQNSNRPGFIALAQLPLIILLSLKSPLPIPVFLPTLSYTHYNFLHRWAGRTMFVCATVHGGMWLNQFRAAGEYDQVWATKSVRGMVAYGLLCMVVLTSLKPIRRMFYQVFIMAHILFMVGFFAAISYHTPYSTPWVIPCAAIYAYDLFVRLCRYRIKDATLVPIDETLTMIHIPDCDAGWLPTQHVHIRVLRGSGVFESHPFTITNAPSTSFSASPRGIILYAKVSGDWTRKLNKMASDVSVLEEGECPKEREAFLEKPNASGMDHPGRRTVVMIDGPYGGLKLDLGDYESVLMVAGGSGITFVLGAIEEALRVKESGRGANKIDVAWVVKDLSTIEALAPTLLHLHILASRLNLNLTYNLYLTSPT